MDMLSYALVAIACVGLALYAVGLLITRRHMRRPAPRTDLELPAISLLKPLKGLEESLEENLTTFFEQRYAAPIEVVFATTERDDPALEVARRVAARHPHIESRFVLSDDAFGLNPKVSNLEGALRAARYDLVLQSDANVRVAPDYLERVVSELLAEEASLLSSIVVGTGERSLGAAMENLQLSAFVAPGTCMARSLAGITCVIGKSMLFRRSELETLGGLALVKDVLAEDFVLGRHYQALGKKVVLSSVPVSNVNVHTTVDRFMSRHARWLKMRAVIHVGGFFADLVCNPVALLLAAFVVSGFAPAIGALLGAVVLLKPFGDAWLVRTTRGTPMRLGYVMAAPLRELMMAAMWPYTAFSRSIEWRGVRLRIRGGSRLVPDTGARPLRALRRMFRLARA